MRLTKKQLVPYSGGGLSTNSHNIFTYKDWFIKLADLEDYELPKYEFLSNLIAKDLEVSIAEFELKTIEDELAFASKRIKPIKDYPLLHAFDYTNGGDYNCSYMLNLTKNKQDFIDMCLFDGLINNTDRHLYNYFYCGEYLMPLFDNHTTFGVRRNKRKELCVPTLNKSKPQLRDYLREFRQQGLSLEIKSFKNRLQNAEESILLQIKKTELDYNKGDFLKHVKKSIGEIYGF